ncbi:MAG: hypothetical protein JJU37_15610 [Balneolaceae bacterium]|nr:hypothetical protein [Balneolaceae bacterium]
MKSLSFYSIITFLFILLISACSRSSTPSKDTVIASVGNSQLTLQQALDEIPLFRLQQDSVSAVLSYTNQWVESQVTIDHANRIGIPNTEEFRRKYTQYRNELLKNLLRDYVIETHQDEIVVSKTEALDYYQTYKEQFVFDEKYVRYRHLTTRTRTEAETANSELMSGVPWEEIVERYSVNPSMQLRQSNLFIPVSMAATDLPPLNQNLKIIGLTERSPIHFINGQYHFVQLMEERVEGEYPDLEWLIPQIQEWLTLEKTRRITNAYLRNLYLQAEANNEIELSNVTKIEQILKSYEN